MTVASSSQRSRDREALEGCLLLAMAADATAELRLIARNPPTLLGCALSVTTTERPFDPWVFGPLTHLSLIPLVRAYHKQFAEED